jgi:cytosine/adenosine deaminase-related metal-dependent hydrolase
MAATESGGTRPHAILALAVFLTVAAVASATAADSLAIVGATLIDGTGAAALTDAVVVVLKGKVRSIGPRSHALLPKGVPYMDGRGFFVLPGRVRDARIAAALRERVARGTAFERALADALREDAPGAPPPTLEPGRPADLAVFDKDPRQSLDHQGSIKRAFVAGREVIP